MTIRKIGNIAGRVAAPHPIAQGRMRSMSTLPMKAVALAAALSVGALALPDTAEAGRRHHGHGGNAAAAAIIGLGVGAIIGGAIASDRYYYAPPPPRVYYAPPPPPQPPYYGPVAYAPPPWTPDWYAYCDSKYRSFDPRSGTFMGYDGLRHFCQ